ncbi:MAG: Fic family protein [Thermoplasmata archaeon]|nr:Fic family protein [Thermoplasmata archaeon]
MTDTDTKYDERLFRRVAGKKARLDAGRPLPASAVARLREEMRLLHTYNSNAIEGNTLSLQETRVVLEEGVTIGGRSLREHMEAVGNAEAFDLVATLADGRRRIDHVTIQGVHALVARGKVEDAGRYRTHNVRITGAVRSPPDFRKVVRLLDRYIRDVARDGSHPIVAAAFVHHRFVEIHPFSDGNGRVARLLMNLRLMRAGYPPVVIAASGRNEYYRALRDADMGDLGPLIDLILRATDASLSIYLSTFGGDDELVPLMELAATSRYSQEYLSLRARQGVLDAVKLGGVWHSTKGAMREYIEARGKR